MSITRDMVEVKTTRVAKQILYEVRLVLTNRNVINVEAFANTTKAERDRMEEVLVEQLANSIVAYAYRDLVPLVNRLASMAGRRSPHPDDLEEINELQTQIGYIMHGIKPPEEKEPSLVITPD